MASLFAVANSRVEHGRALGDLRKRHPNSWPPQVPLGSSMDGATEFGWLTLGGWQ